MQVTTNDGVRFQGTPTQIVTQMRLAAHVPSATNQIYMTTVASQVMLWNTATIATTDEDAFVQSLLDAGLLQQSTD